MLEAFPFVPLGGHVRIGVAIFSYDGGINFGVTGDWDSAADIGVLCRAIEHGVAELRGPERSEAVMDGSSPGGSPGAGPVEVEEVSAD